MFGFRRRRPNKARAHTEAIEQEHDAQLAQAEADLADLTARGEKAMRTLDTRQERNHWREAVEQMIQSRRAHDPRGI
jgi:hypothetical protein